MSNNVEKLIGIQIARYRKDREITQEQLAQLVNVAFETISRLERGVSIPSLKTLEKISQALNTSLKDFFDFEQPQKAKSRSFENECSKLIAFLKTKNADDIKMCYRIVKAVFEQIDKNYPPEKN
ncbi:MAG: helix-turn-helix domain-containing protein [Candidatus Anammoxibacter sp.]